MAKLITEMQDREQFQSAIVATEQVLEAARQRGMRVIHCGLSFQSGYPELGKAQYGLREAIARNGTFSADGTGSQFVEPFTPQGGEFVTPVSLKVTGVQISSRGILFLEQGCQNLRIRSCPIAV